MGVSTDGILVYGVDLGERYEVELPWLSDDEDDDFDSWFCSLHGVSADALWAQFEEWAESPEGQEYAGYNRVKEYGERNPQWRQALDEVHDAARALEADAPIEIVHYCSGDYPMIIVAVPGTRVRAARGETQTISSLEVDPEKVAKATAFCAEHNIPFENPSWLLASMWG